jgi:hypothetical protein
VVNDFPLTTARYNGQPLLESDPIRTQRRYRVQLWLEGINTDIVSDPDSDGKLNASKDKFTFLVVSEAELLGEIGKEEETIYSKLLDVLKALEDGQTKLANVTYDLDKSDLQPDNFGAMAARAQEVDLVLDKNEVKVKEALADYTRILQELRINQVRGDKVDRVDKGIVTPLGDIVDRTFPNARDKVQAFNKVLDDKNAGTFPQHLAKAKESGKDAKQKVLELINALRLVSDELQGIMDLAKLLEEIRLIKQKEQDQRDFLDRIMKLLLADLFGGPDKKPQ